MDLPAPQPRVSVPPVPVGFDLGSQSRGSERQIPGTRNLLLREAHGTGHPSR